MPLTKVSSGVIAANAVVDSFGTQSITGDKLGLTAINANNIVDATITGAKLTSATITGDKIGVGQITSNLFAAGAVSTSNISSGNSNVSVTSANGNVTIGTAGSERMRITSDGNLQFNSGYGSVATAYGCRAWVNFDGTGTPAIRASGNVSSITDNGTGDYTVNFTTALVDNNYGIATGGMRDSDNNGSLNLTAIKLTTYGTGVATSYIRVLAENDSGTRVDPLMYCVQIFR